MSSRSVQRSILLVVSGVCHSTQSSGGWGYVVCYPNGVEREGSGAAAETAANRLELTAAIEGLKSLGSRNRGILVRVLSSSHYLVDGGKGTRGRTTNADLWAQLDAQLKNRSVTWEWEPPDTMLIQSQAYDLARLALKRALKGTGLPQPGPR